MTVGIQGNLKDFPLPEVIMFIAQASGTGELELKSDDDRQQAVIKFEGGKIITAEPSGPRKEQDRIGSLLVRSELITPDQLKEALKVQKESLQKIGHIFIKEGFVKRDDLKDILQVQVKETIFHLFQWEEGSYQFRKKSRIEYDRDLYTPRDAQNTIMEGARMVDEWPHIRRLIYSNEMVFRKNPAYASITLEETAAGGKAKAGELDVDNLDNLLAGLGQDSAPEQQEVSLSLSGKEGITREQAVVFDLVDGKRSVEKIVNLSRLGEFTACDALKNLYELGFVEPVEDLLVKKPKGLFFDLSRQKVAKMVTWLAVIPVILFAVLLLRSLIAGLEESRHFISPWGEEVRARQEILQTIRLEKSLDVYFFERQVQPRTLVELVQDGYLHPGDLTDPWGEPYQYQPRKEGFILFSVGAKSSDETGR